MKLEANTHDLLTKYKQQAFERKISQYEMMRIEYKVIRDASGLIIDVVTDADKRMNNTSIHIETNKTDDIIDNDTNTDDDAEAEADADMWHGAYICDDYKYPMPTFCLKDKNYHAKEFGALMTISNIDPIIKDRFVYKNKFNTADLAKDLSISRVTLERNIKKLEKLDYNILSIESTRQNGIVYKLEHGALNDKTGNINKFVTIYQAMLKELVCSFNSNAIKIYCLLSYMCNETEFKLLTEDWICEQIGLNGNSERNQSTVRTLIKTLEKCKFIETRKQNIFRWDDKRKREVPQITKFYRLCTLDEWKKLDKKVD